MDQDQLEAPLSYLSAPDGWRSLWPLYSQCALQACLSESLLSENRKRLLHLDKAVRHLNEKSEALHNSANRLRQEQIIEDIEVLLG
jgi:F-type H+-transporting ATPase subunit gamma